MLGLFLSTALAQAAADTAAAQPARPGIADFAVPLVLIMAVFYFFSARPQQKRLKDHQVFLTGMKRGDSVITSSGILGEVYGITEKVVTLQIDDNTRIRVLRTQIMGSAKEGSV